MRLLLILALSAALPGCASIVGGADQTVSVRALNDTDQVVGAMCEIVSNKGTWYVTTPGTVPISRGYEDLAVTCRKQDLEPGIVTVKSATKGMAFGNILFGGIIGAAVDMGTGAAYEYPSLITVHMGQTTTLEPPKPDTPAATTDQGMPANPQDAPQSMRAHPDAPQHDGASQGI